MHFCREPLLWNSNLFNLTLTMQEEKCLCAAVEFGKGQSEFAENTLPATVMVLLRWCTLSPQGPSGLAAILFPSPVKVSSIALFPTGAHPFSQCPDVVAYVVQPPFSTTVRHGSLHSRTTEPQAFFLDVYFNTSFIRPCTQEPQLKNALVPTRIAYAGGQVEFRVDMGSEVCLVRIPEFPD